MNLIQLKQIEGLQAYIQQNVPAVLDGYQVVFQTGDQFISGDKTFFSHITASGGAFISGNLFTTGSTTTLEDSLVSGDSFVSGELWITGSNGLPVQLTTFVNPTDNPYLVYVTGEQQISGTKIFQQSITGNQEALISGNAYVSGQLWITGSDGLPLQITGCGGGGGAGGGTSPVNQPYLVYVTGEQQISGTKIFQQSITGNQEALISGNAYVSGQLWITGSDGLPLQIDGSVQDGGSVTFDYITCIGLTGQHLSGHRLDIGPSGASISGNTYITGDLTVIGEVSLTGGAVVGEADGDSIFIIGVANGNDPRVGIGQYNGISDVVSLFHVSGNPNDTNFTLQGDQFTSGDQYVTGELWITGSNGLPIQITNNSTANVNGPLSSVQYNSGSELGGLPVLYYGDYGKNDTDATDNDTFNSGALVFAGIDSPSPNCKAIISSGSSATLATTNFGVVFRRLDHPTVAADVSEAIVLGSYPENGGWSADGIGDSSESYSVLAADLTNKGIVINGPPGYMQSTIPSNLGNYDLVVYNSDQTEPGTQNPIEKAELGVVKAGSLSVTGENAVFSQLKPFGLNSTDITTDYTLDSSRNNQIIHFDPSTKIEITLPTTDDFIDFKFTARHVNNGGNYVGFKSDDASTVHGVSTGFNAEHDWATIYRGNADWYIYGNNLISDPGTPTTTTSAPTTTAAPTTTIAPTTTTSAPTTTATPTTTTAAPTNTKLLTQGLMMRFFGWDDSFSDTTSSFGSNQAINVNGSQVTRDVIYPSYQDSSLPQLTGAFSTSSYSNWADATEEITDVNNVKHTGIYLKDGYYMNFPQFQYNANGGQWDSFGGNMDFLTGYGDPLNVGDGWTLTWWSYNKWPSSSYDPRDTHRYKITNIGGNFTTPRNIGYVMKLEGTERVILRGNEDNFIYATEGTEGTQSDRNLNNAPETIKHTTGGWWNFHSISYAGGTFSSDAAEGENKGNNVQWAIGTGLPSENNFIQTFSGDGSANGLAGALGIEGGVYAGDSLGTRIGDTSAIIDQGGTDVFSIGFNNNLGEGTEKTMPWTGYISDLRMYNRPLGTGEINSIFTGKGAV